MNVIPDLVRWLYRVLSTDSTLLPLITSPVDGKPRVWENQATETRKPSGYVPIYPGDSANFPCVRFELVECEHTTGNGGRRFASSPLLLIEAIDEGESIIGEEAGNSPVLEAIANRIDELFGSRAVGQEGRLTISGSVAEEDYADTENKPGGVYKHLGGVYSFFVFKTPV